MSSFPGKVVVITGAASGIGRAMAGQLAARGARLALSDINATGLDETLRSLPAGTDARAYHLDTTDRTSVVAHAEAVRNDFGTAHYVFNNAGATVVGTIAHLSIEEIEWQLAVNLWGVIYGTKAFLPHLIASGDGHVINISSVFGLFAVPGQAAYNSAKFAVRGFTEALRQEMMLARHPVKVTTVHPGGIRTAIARNATAAEGLDTAGLAEWFDTKMARTSPERAAQIILEGVAENKARVLVGTDAKILDIFVRVTGPGYHKALVALARRAMPPTR